MRISDDLFLGVDPGVTGAWSLLTSKGTVYAAGLWEARFNLLALFKRDVLPVCCCLEKVASMPRQGVKSVFTFGKNAGYWLGVMEALQIPVIEITPEKWQKTVLDYRPTKLPKQQTETVEDTAKRRNQNRNFLKQHIVNFVYKRFPDSVDIIKLKKHYDIADAICLAEYARKYYTVENP